MADIRKIDPRYEIERLLTFGLRNGLIEEMDVAYTRNLLMDLLKIDTPYEGALPVEDDEIPETATPILENLLDRSGCFGNFIISHSYPGKPP